MVLGHAQRILFVTKKRVAKTPTVPVKAPTGEIRVSTPEATALDLVRYPPGVEYDAPAAVERGRRELIEGLPGEPWRGR